MSISLTASAADRVRSHLVTRGRGLGLRLGIKTTGCSGFSYVIDYADAVAPNDLVFERQGRMRLRRELHGLKNLFLPGLPPAT